MVKKELTPSEKRKIKEKELKNKTDEAMKTVESIINNLKKEFTKDFGKVRVKYKEGELVKDMRKKTASKLKKLAQLIEGRKIKKK